MAISEPEQKECILMLGLDGDGCFLNPKYYEELEKWAAGIAKIEIRDVVVANKVAELLIKNNSLFFKHALNLINQKIEDGYKIVKIILFSDSGRQSYYLEQLNTFMNFSRFLSGFFITKIDLIKNELARILKDRNISTVVECENQLLIDSFDSSSDVYALAKKDEEQMKFIRDCKPNEKFLPDTMDKSLCTNTVKSLAVFCQTHRACIKNAKVSEIFCLIYDDNEYFLQNLRDSLGILGIPKLVTVTGFLYKGDVLPIERSLYKGESEVLYEYWLSLRALLEKSNSPIEQLSHSGEDEDKAEDYKNWLSSLRNATKSDPHNLNFYFLHNNVPYLLTCYLNPLRKNSSGQLCYCPDENTALKKIFEMYKTRPITEQIIGYVMAIAFFFGREYNGKINFLMEKAVLCPNFNLEELQKNIYAEIDSPFFHLGHRQKSRCYAIFAALVLDNVPIKQINLISLQEIVTSYILGISLNIIGSSPTCDCNQILVLHVCNWIRNHHPDQSEFLDGINSRLMTISKKLGTPSCTAKFPAQNLSTTLANMFQNFKTALEKALQQPSREISHRV